MNLYFKEKQKFTQWWLWTLLIGITLLPVYGIYQQIILDKPFGNNPMPNIGLLLSLVILILLLVFFGMMQLKTKVTQELIYIKFSPFIQKTIYWKDIKSAEVVNYGFVGGWGVRLGTKYGIVYNVRGNKGLAIELKNGKKLCVGTQKDMELERMIKKL